MNERELAILFLALRCWDDGSPLFGELDVAGAIQKYLKSIGSTALGSVWDELGRSDARVRVAFDAMVDAWADAPQEMSND